MLGSSLLILLATTPAPPSYPYLETKGRYEEQLESGQYSITTYIGYKQLSFQTQDLEDFIRISEELVERYPEEPEPYFGLAEAWFISGKKNRGLDVLDRLFKRDREMTLRIGNTLERFELYKEAVGFYERYRRQRKSDAYFSDELIRTYQFAQDYRGATREIVSLINRTPGSAARYERVLASFLDEIEPKIIINEVKKIKPVAERSKILARLFINLKQYDAAAKEFKKASSKNELLEFARLCVDAGAYEPAQAIYQKLNLWVEQAECLRRLGRSKEAAMVLAKDRSLPALMEQALIYRDDLKDPKKAHELYQAILKTEPDYKPAQAGLLETLVKLGELKKAEETLNRISGVSDWVLFYKIELNFFKGEFDSIADYALKLSQQFPESPLLNDGLEMALLAKQTDPSLKDYTQALFDYESSHYDNGIAILKGIINKGSSLADDSYLLLAKCYRAKREPQLALAALQELEEKFPQSPVLARMRLERGLIYKEDLKDLKTAKKTLEDLIVDYPDTPQACIARNLLSLAKM